MTGGSTRRFYDGIAEYYDLIYTDWEGAMRRQGDAIAAMLGSSPSSGARLLDVSAGIGTQSLPLARLGYEVVARDVSPAAIERLRREASARNLAIDAAVADMRNVDDSVDGAFDAVISFDNSLPHLLTDVEIGDVLGRFAGLLRPGGVLLVSVRDYDRVDRSRTSSHPYGERQRDGRRYRLRQEWAWTDPQRYRTTLLVEEEVDGSWEERVRSHACYYAISTGRLLHLMESAGFTATRIGEPAFFQPVLRGVPSDGPPGRDA